jgi:fatty acid desaturase
MWSVYQIQIKLQKTLQITKNFVIYITTGYKYSTGIGITQMQFFQFNLESIDAAKDNYSTSSTVIRESMERLPKWIQGFLTWLTTRPLPNQKYVNHSSYYQVTTALLSLVSGLALSMLALQKTGAYELLLFISLLLTVSGMRKLQVVIYHHCSHGTVFKSKWANLLLGEVISIVLMVKEFRTYKKDHMAHHNANKLLTYEDETAQDIGEIGILPGVPKDILWQRLLLSFISPFAHVRWILVRIKNCLLSISPLHNVIAISYWGALFFLINHFQLWEKFFIVWLFPLTILYHTSRMLRLVAEHRWPSTEVLKSRGRMFIYGCCF